MSVKTVDITTTTRKCDNLSRITEVEKLEKNIEKLITGSLPYYRSIFKQIMSANFQNADLLYTFLLTEQNERNVKLNTKITYIKIIYIFNKFLDFKDFSSILTYISS